MRKLINIIYFIMLLLCSINCNDVPNPIKKSAEWKGIKCKIDGKEWESCTTISHPGNSFVIYTGQYFSLSATNWCKHDTFTNVSIMIKSVPFDTGKFEINQYNEGSVVITDGKDWLFRTNNIQKGELYLSNVDRTKQTLSGEFEFEAFDTANKKTIKITQGVIKNIYYNKY